MPRWARFAGTVPTRMIGPAKLTAAPATPAVVATPSDDKALAEPPIWAANSDIGADAQTAHKELSGLWEIAGI
jgi:hypothetical protein